MYLYEHAGNELLVCRKKYMRISEIPYKSPQNMLWIYEGIKTGIREKCKDYAGRYVWQRNGFF